MRKTNSAWPLKLSIFVILIGLIVVSSSAYKASADDYSCEQQYSFCVYNCAVGYSGDPSGYNACRAQCEMNSNGCHVCENYGFPQGCMDGVDIPEPYPVFANFSMCMDDCNTSCNWLPLGERSACFVPCKANCIALYGT